MFFNHGHGIVFRADSTHRKFAVFPIMCAQTHTHLTHPPSPHICISTNVDVRQTKRPQSLSYAQIRYARMSLQIKSPLRGCLSVRQMIASGFNWCSRLRLTWYHSNMHARDGMPCPGCRFVENASSSLVPFKTKRRMSMFFFVVSRLNVSSALSKRTGLARPANRAAMCNVYPRKCNQTT